MLESTFWKNFKSYPIVGHKKDRGIYIIELPRVDVLDHYSALDADKLKKAYKSTRNSELKEVLESIMNETEYNTEGTMTLGVYDGSSSNTRTSEPFRPANKSDTALIATVIQGVDSKFEAALSECLKRGIKFTIKQAKAAKVKGRILPTS